MKAKKIDNFSNYRQQMKLSGKMLSIWPSLPKTGDLAEYIGVVLGDGNISKFPRTERIIIVGNSNNLGFIQRYAKFTQDLLGKAPTITKIKNTNAFRISLYQKHISRRLGIAMGNRKGVPYILPKWIERNKSFSIRFLRGLFEAEGSLNIHLPTCTYNFAFTNFNKSLLDIVETILRKLEFHPEIRNNAIRIRRKAEVEKLRKLLSFREY